MSSVQVAVRARPPSKREVELGTPFCIEMRGQSTVIYKSGLGSGRSLGRSNAKEFVYDYSYWSVDTRDDHYVGQEQLFNDLGVPVLKSAFEGYNTCIFAYGQTGSGKTHTMMGQEMAAGLIPRICEGLFSRMGEGMQEGEEKVSYRTEVSYMEIYNEKVRDLLHTAAGKTQHSLRVREHPRDGPYVEDLSKHLVSEFAGISRLIDMGNSHRSTASTKMNDTSSRSHAIFTISFTQAKYKSDLPMETVSKLNLVDLAGSERASATGSEGERLKEGGNINRSLVCLGTVISSLADLSSHSGRQKKAYIPYRDSVLTWLLKDSLGGNSKTIMIATISPAESSYGETLSTLRYASRAKNIVNRPTVNEDPNVKMIRDLRVEIQRLKSIISSGQMDGSGDERCQGVRRERFLAEDIYRKEEQVAELTREWAEKWKDMQRIIQERHLALHSDGMKMVVDSAQPHFVGVDPDILSTGLVFYYLRDGHTTIGARSVSHQPDVVVSGLDIHPEHCAVQFSRGKVLLRPLKGECYINHRKIKNPARLSQGDLLQLGKSAVFRFNHPQEAHKLRKRHSEGLLRSSKCTRPVQAPARETSPELTGSPTVPYTTAVCTAPEEKPRSKSDSDVPLLSSKWETHLPMLPRQNQLSGEPAIPGHQEYVKGSWLYYIILWMTAPIIFVTLGTLMFPAFSVLAALLLSMKMCGLSQRFAICRWMACRWLATLVAISTTIMVSPITGLCDVLFRLGYSVFTSFRIAQSHRPIQELV